MKDTSECRSHSRKVAAAVPKAVTVAVVNVGIFLVMPATKVVSQLVRNYEFSGAVRACSHDGEAAIWAAVENLPATYSREA